MKRVMRGEANGTGVVTALIVDDEPLARERIRDLLAGESDVEVLGELDNGEDARRAIDELSPDLVFLDIEMPELNGLQLLETMSRPAPITILITAYHHYAVSAFETDAVDFLPKPFTEERFREALDRARDLLRHHRMRAAAAHEVPALLERIGGRPAYLQRFAVRIGSKLVLVPAETVEWIGADGNYARLHVGERTYLVRETMNRLMDRLDPDRFLRVHRSSILNLDAVRHVEVDGGVYTFRMKGGETLTSSEAYVERISRVIGDVAG